MSPELFRSRPMLFALQIDKSLPSNWHFTRHVDSPYRARRSQKTHIDRAFFFLVRTTRSIIWSWSQSPDLSASGQHVYHHPSEDQGGSQCCLWITVDPPRQSNDVPPSAAPNSAYIDSNTPAKPNCMTTQPHTPLSRERRVRWPSISLYSRPPPSLQFSLQTCPCRNPAT